MITKLIYSYCARPDPSTRLRSKHLPGLRSFSEGRLEGFLRALQDTLRQAQGEREKCFKRET